MIQEKILIAFLIIVILTFPFLVIRQETDRDGVWRPKYGDGRYMSKKKAIGRLIITEMIFLIGLITAIRNVFF